MILTGTALLALKAVAVKIGPILAAKAAPLTTAKVSVALAGGGGVALIGKLAGTPALKAIAVKLTTSEAFQAFAVKLATSEVGKTIIVKGIRIIVTDEMKEELKDMMSKDPKLAEAISKATGSTAGKVSGNLLDSLN